MEYLIFSGAFMLVMFSIIWLISYISSFKEPCPLPNGVYEPEFIVADPYALSAVALSPQGFAPANAHPSIFELSQAELMHRCTAWYREAVYAAQYFQLLRERAQIAQVRVSKAVSRDYLEDTDSFIQNMHAAYYAFATTVHRDDQALKTAVAQSLSCSFGVLLSIAYLPVPESYLTDEKLAHIADRAREHQQALSRQIHDLETRYPAITSFPFDVLHRHLRLAQTLHENTHHERYLQGAQTIYRHLTLLTDAFDSAQSQLSPTLKTLEHLLQQIDIDHASEHFQTLTEYRARLTELQSAVPSQDPITVLVQATQLTLDIVKAFGYAFSADTKNDARALLSTTTETLISANLARTNVYTLDRLLPISPELRAALSQAHVQVPQLYEMMSLSQMVRECEHLMKSASALHHRARTEYHEKFSAFTHEEILSTVTEALTRSSAELQTQAQHCLEQFQCDALAAEKRDSGTDPLVYWTPALTQDTVFLFHAERHGWRWGWRKSLVRGDYSPLRALY